MKKMLLIAVLFTAADQVDLKINLLGPFAELAFSF